MFFQKNIRLFAVCCILLLSFSSVTLAKFPKMNMRNGYAEPFKMFDNLYYVGDRWTSSYLVTSAQGHILIDTLQMPYSRWLPENIKKLGLELRDIKYILVTHGHTDHGGGVAYLKSLTGSKVAMSEGATELLGNRDKALSEVVDIKLHDSQVIKVGELEITSHATPGHTMGDISFTFDVIDNSKKHRAFVLGGAGLNFEGSEQLKHYIESMEKILLMAKSKPLIEVNLTGHPHLNKLFELKREMKTGEASPFIDGSGFEIFIQELIAKAVKKQKNEG